MRKAAGSLLAWGFLGALGVVLRRASNEARKLRAMDAAPFDFAPRPATPRAGRTEDDLTDDELVARVQAQVEVPPDVEVFAEDGAVVLFGRVPRALADGLLRRVQAIEGVTDLQDRLTRVDFVQPQRAPGPPDRP
jgi:osmotically-inducible protein OsmY